MGMQVTTSFLPHFHSWMNSFSVSALPALLSSLCAPSQFFAFLKCLEVKPLIDVCHVGEAHLEEKKKEIYLSGIIFAYESLWLDVLQAFVDVPFKQVIKIANPSVLKFFLCPSLPSFLFSFLNFSNLSSSLVCSGCQTWAPEFGQSCGQSAHAPSG